MPAELIVDLVPALFATLLLLFLLPGAVRAVRTWTGAGHRRQEDATGRAPEPDDDIRDRIAALTRLGYRAIGETRTRVPGGDAFAWVLAADDGTSYALLVQGSRTQRGLTGVYTAWPDGTWLGTFHPRGRPLSYRGLELLSVSGTLADVAAAHREEVTRASGLHGPPRPVRTIADVLVLDADYRTRFGGRELRSMVAWALLPTAIALGMTIVSVAALFTRP